MQNGIKKMHKSFSWVGLLSFLGELKNVTILLSSYQRVHQCINIVIVDILEAYNVLLSRDWSSKLQGYFSIDWSLMASVQGKIK